MRYLQATAMAIIAALVKIKVYLKYSGGLASWYLPGGQKYQTWHDDSLGPKKTFWNRLLNFFSRLHQKRRPLRENLNKSIKWKILHLQ